MSSLKIVACDTTAGNAMPCKEMANEASKFVVSNNKLYKLGVLDGDHRKVVFITGWENTVPRVSIPFPVKVDVGDKKYLVADARHYTKDVPSYETDDIEEEDIDKHLRQTYITNYERNIVRFTLAVEDSGREVANMLGPVPMLLFSRLITNSLANNFNLNPFESAVVSFVASIYYRTQFYTEDELDYSGIVSHASSHTVLKQNDISVIAPNLLKSAFTIEELCNNFKRGLGQDNNKLKSLTPEVLIALLSSSWVVKDSGTTMAVALECMPVFLSIVYSTATDGSVKRFNTYRVMRTLKPSDIKNYIQRANYLLADYSAGD